MEDEEIWVSRCKFIEDLFADLNLDIKTASEELIVSILKILAEFFRLCDYTQMSQIRSLAINSIGEGTLDLALERIIIEYDNIEINKSLVQILNSVLKTGLAIISLPKISNFIISELTRYIDREEELQEFSAEIMTSYLASVNNFYSLNFENAHKNVCESFFKTNMTCLRMINLVFDQKSISGPLKNSFLSFWTNLGKRGFILSNSEQKNMTLAQCTKLIIRNMQNHSENAIKQEMGFFVLRILMNNMDDENIDYQLIFDDSYKLFKMIDENVENILRYLSIANLMLTHDANIFSNNQENILDILSTICHHWPAIMQSESLEYITQTLLFFKLIISLMPGRAAASIVYKYELLDMIESLLGKRFIIDEKDLILALAVLTFLNGVVAHQNLITIQTSEQLFRLTTAPFKDFFKKSDILSSLKIMPRLFQIYNLIALKDLSNTYEILANFVSYHRDFLVGLIPSFNPTDKTHSILLSAVCGTLECMLVKDYYKCLKEFGDIINSFAEIPLVINSKISLVHNQSEKEPQIAFELLKFCCALVQLFYARTLPLGKLLAKLINFEKKDLFYFNTQNINKSLHGWTDFAHSIMILTNSVKDDQEKFAIYPTVKLCFEKMCFVSIAQLYMLDKTISTCEPVLKEEMFHEFAHHTKSLLYFLSHKQYTASPIKSPKRAVKILPNALKLSSISIDADLHNCLEKALLVAFNC